jgi:ribokinase
MYPDPAEPVDRTGAGDSFASTFTAAIILGFSPDVALSWGPINSMSVVQYVGAQAGLLSREKLEEYLANRPAEYVATKIS